MFVIVFSREAEQAFEAMQREREPAARRDALQGLGWEGRLSAMGASLRQLAPVLAVRDDTLRVQCDNYTAAVLRFTLT